VRQGATGTAPVSKDVLVNANDVAIARAIIALAHSLGLYVVAEGVETQEQFEFMNASGCTFFQGYLFGPPAPLDAGDVLLVVS
jgi:EAL domain-containing protein (putative c-di-GMP-specific phosphodiesterase class I)